MMDEGAVHAIPPDLVNPKQCRFPADILLQHSIINVREFIRHIRMNTAGSSDLKTFFRNGIVWSFQEVYHKSYLRNLPVGSSFFPIEETVVFYQDFLICFQEICSRIAFSQKLSIFAWFSAEFTL